MGYFIIQRSKRTLSVSKRLYLRTFCAGRVMRLAQKGTHCLLLTVLCLSLLLAPLPASVRSFVSATAPVAMPAFVNTAHAAFGLGEVSVQDEIELGKKFNVLIRSRLPLVEDPEVVNYVRGIVDRLIAVAPPQPFSFQTSVLRDNSLNAFATPGGYIFVHTGLILNVDHESEVAGVLAHEIAHVTQRHVAKRIENSQKISMLSMAGVLAALLLGKGDGQEAMLTGSMAAGQSAMLNYSRADEREADFAGMQYMQKAQFPPQGLPNAFLHIRNQQWRSGGGSMPQYLSTHPDVSQRIEYLNGQVALLPKEQRERAENDTKFRRIQTLIRARYADQDAALVYFGTNTTLEKPLALMGQGIVYGLQNKIALADSYFEQAIQATPNDPLVLREAGRFQFAKGSQEEAGKLLQKSVMLNPRDQMALFFYARLLAEKGQRAQAEQYYKDILRALPEDSEVHYYFGRMLGEDRRIFEARIELAYSALYQNNKKMVLRHYNQAKSLAKTDEEKAQLERFEKAWNERKEFW